ncbi:hypothetical protein J7T55_004987 [Diaporthe amygdali]|uniref:uncharacterized protein n=1 Tax=Phomopsis amygdali TaxID=1214568 RepID=UPI0022FE51C6|nr:uncharacterized protein J7T55_004987 [Diaporthe amygdali]KAJ0116042.1 hypothetical protein J7T55_004987 [Diaporthe amygdali]
MDASRRPNSYDQGLAPVSAEVAPRATGTSPLEKSPSMLNNEADVADVAVDTVGRRRKPLSFYMAFLCLVIMVFLCSIDSTIMAVSIPIITQELGGTTFEAFWANLAFTLTVVVSLPIYASASDVLGRKIPLYTCYVLFFVGSIVFATADSMAVVIIGRLLQGLGGGGLDVLNEILIVDITTLKERPLYMGLMAIPMALGTIAGPIIGAAFSEYVSWRWLGWMNIPLLGVDVALAVLFLRLKPLDEPLSDRFARLDWIGSLMFAIGAAAFVLPLSWAGNLYSWSSWNTIVPLVIGLIVLVVFAFYEAKPEAPLFPHRIFKSRASLLTLLTGTIHGLIIYPATTYLPLFFQAVKLQSPLQSAVSLLPSCCGVVGFALFSGVAIEISRRYLWQFWISWITISIGIGLLSILDRNSPVAETAGFQIISGVGLGALWAVPALSMQASAATVEDQALAVGILVAVRLFGALIGLAIASSVFASIFEKSIAALQPLPAAVAPLGQASQAVGFIPSLRGIDVPSNVLSQILEVYRESFQVLWYVMAGFACVGFFSSLFIQEKSIENEETGKQHLQTREKGAKPTDVNVGGFAAKIDDNTQTRSVTNTASTDCDEFMDATSGNGTDTTSHSSHSEDPGKRSYFDVPKLCQRAINEPIDYVSGMPSKGVRSSLIDAMNQWCQIPSAQLAVVKRVIDLLHNAATFLYVRVVQEVQATGNAALMTVLLEELDDLHVGQSWDLYWKYNLKWPTKDEYFSMIDLKTGGLFRMLPLLPDDYLNLNSREYSNQKGWCEDLDEGKFSYLIIHCLENSPKYADRIMGLFRQRTGCSGPMPSVAKV